MIRTFLTLRNVDPGFKHPESIQTLHIFIPEQDVKEPERVMRVQEEMMKRLAAIPGVQSVALSNGAPMEGFNWNDLVYAEDKAYAAGDIPPIRRFRFVTPGTLQTVGTPLITGRDFTWTDLYDKRHVAIVSLNLAREMWGSPDAAIGKRVRTDMKSPWREVVGVAGDLHDNGIQEKAATMVYWPALMDAFGGDQVSVRRGAVFLIHSDRAGTESFLKEARQAIWSVDANLPIFLVGTLKEIYDQSMSRTSFTLVMLGIAGLMALTLGIVGIYGVIAYAVSQRTREIGIRIALGAQTLELRGMFVRDGLVLAGIGAAIGLVAAVALTRLMSALLFGVSALDVQAYTLSALVLIGAAALASYFSARTATTVDPVEALRAE